MPGNELRHFEHRNFTLSSKYRLELLICHDISLVLRILEIVLLDVLPDLLDHFSTRHRAFAYDRLEVSGEVHRL